MHVSILVHTLIYMRKVVNILHSFIVHYFQHSLKTKQEGRNVLKQLAADLLHRITDHTDR